MTTTRPFAYNIGFSIPGTEQLGDLAIGIPTSGFTNSPQFWNGPDEDLGYVIAHPTPSGNQPNPLSIPAYVGFWRSTALTDNSFISLAQYVSDYNGTPQIFTGGTEAKTWLNNNGFWTSYSGGSSGETTGNYNLMNSYSPATNNGWITFPGSDNQPSNNPNTVGLNPGNGIYINKLDLLGNDQSSILDLLVGRNGSLTLTQGSNFVTYNFTNTAFNYSSSGPYANQYWWDNYHNGPQSPLATITVISSSPSNFNYVNPITITVS